MDQDDPSQPDPEMPPLVEADPELETVAGELGFESQLVLERALQKLLGRAGAPIKVGRYRITRRLGAGAMGLVYAGHDDALDREVAIKLLQSQLAGSEASRQRLVREAQAMARLNHPNVAHVYEVGEHDDQLFIAMELVRGETLRQWQRERERTVPEILAMHLQAARGLAAAHDVGLVHRDYKPDNVMIDEAGRARVMDFGLARHSGEAFPSGEHPPAGSGASSQAMAKSPLFDDATVTGTVMGTPAYMAPEQLVGHRVDHRADQFAFCVALYEALHGHRPFTGKSTTGLVDAIERQDLRREDREHRGVPMPVRALLRQGLAFAPDARWASMHAIVRVLEAQVGSARAPSVGLRWGVAALAIAGASAAAIVIATNPTTAVPVVVAHEDPWASIVAGSQLPAPLSEALPDDPAHVTIHRLRNGLTVYIAPKPGVPSIDTAVVVRADATDESPEQSGVAALLQSELGGSDRLGTVDPAAEAPILAREQAALAAIVPGDGSAPSKLAEAREAYAARRRLAVDSEFVWLGGELGFGSLAQEAPPGTTRAQQVPRHRLAAWATLAAEALRRPAHREFLPSLSYEVEMHRDAAEDAARVAIDRGVGALAGWRIDDVTAAKALLAVPFEPMRRFWRDYYRPNNIAIVLVGDVSAAEALPILEAAFGDWEPAVLPARPVLPEGGGELERVIDDGLAQVTLAWPRGDGMRATDAIENLLLRSSLAERWLEDDGRARWLSLSPQPFSIELAVTPRPGHTLADAEAALQALLLALARGEVEADAIAVAQAQAQLHGLTWSSSNYGLSLVIAQSFARRVDWRDQLATLRGDPLGPEAIAASARALLERAPVIVHREPGPPVDLGLAPLTFASVGPGAQGPSAFAAALIAAPISRLEPQFLVPGSELSLRPWGKGRVITMEHDVPVQRLQWILPVGVADDPWTCDAWRARVRALQPGFERAAASLSVTCGVHDTTIDVAGVATRVDEWWPRLAALREPELSSADAERQLRATQEARVTLRASSWAREEALALVALRGDDGQDANLPDDAALARAEPAVLQRALARSLEVACDVLVAGPDAAAIGRRLVASMPTPPERAPHPLVLPRPRSLKDTTVFVMDDPGRARAQVRAGLILTQEDGTSRLLTDVLRQAEATVRVDAAEPLSRFSMPHLDTLDGRAVFDAQGADCGAVDVPAVLAAMVASIRTPPDARALARARGFVETDFRRRRRTGIEAARYAWSWAAATPGATEAGLDPGLAEWTALGTIDDAALLTYHARIAKLPVVLSVIADLRRIDRAALAKLGEVVNVTVDQLRDPQLTDRMLFGFAAEAP